MFSKESLSQHLKEISCGSVCCYQLLGIVQAIEIYLKGHFIWCIGKEIASGRLLAQDLRGGGGYAGGDGALQNLHFSMPNQCQNEHKCIE